MADSALLTLAEASSLLRLKISTLRAWILHRRIPYVKFSRRVFLRRSDIEELIEQGLVPAVPARKADNDPDFGLAPVLRDREQGSVGREVRDGK